MTTGWPSFGEWTAAACSPCSFLMVALPIPVVVAGPRLPEWLYRCVEGYAGSGDGQGVCGSHRLLRPLAIDMLRHPILGEIELNRLLGSQQLLYAHPNEADLLPLGVFAGFEEGLHQPMDLNLQLLQRGSRVLARV